MHEHYRDTCTVMQGQRIARDRCFYLVIAVVAIGWFDVVAPQDVATIVGQALKSKLQLTVVPDLRYLRSILWFLLLGLTVRYCQTALSVERHYDYIHDIEALLSKHVHESVRSRGRGVSVEVPTISDMVPLSLCRRLPGGAARSRGLMDASAGAKLAAGVMVRFCLVRLPGEYRDRRVHPSLLGVPGSRGPKTRVGFILCASAPTFRSQVMVSQRWSSVCNSPF